jgi:Cu(I)/Ag(I) efflux system periplasmic protein CusF
MFHRTRLAPRVRRLTPPAAALLVGLAPAFLPMVEVQAQSSQGGMSDMPGTGSGAASEAEKPSAVGTVNSVNAGERKINLSHEPIPAIKWPSMTMDFPVASSVDLSQVQPGTKVQFTLTRGAGGTYTVETIRPMAQ